MVYWSHCRPGLLCYVVIGDVDVVCYSSYLSLVVRHHFGFGLSEIDHKRCVYYRSPPSISFSPPCYITPDRCRCLDYTWGFYSRIFVVRRNVSAVYAVARPLVCLPVTTPTGMAQYRITQTTPHNSPESQGFCCRRYPQKLKGDTPSKGARCMWAID